MRNAELLRDHFQNKQKLAKKLKNRLMWTTAKRSSDSSKLINESIEGYDKLVTSEQKNKYISNLLGTQNISKDDLHVVLSFLEHGTGETSPKIGLKKTSSSQRRSNLFLANKRYSVENSKKPYLISP